MSESELDSCKKKPTCKNTERTKLWAVRVFNDWINNIPGSEAEKYAELDLWCEDSEKVCQMLSMFIAEARQSSGEAYTPMTLLQLMTNLQAFAYTKHPHACHFMNQKDVHFQPLHSVLNNLSEAIKQRYWS